MISLILRTTTRFLLPLLLLFSIFLLMRGHNEPGGGFVAGLVAAAAYALYSIAFDVTMARRALWIDPHTLVGIGLLTAAGSATLSLLVDKPFMTGQWSIFVVPGLDKVELGTPVLFDVGVFLVVIGVTLMIIFTLAEET